MLNIQTKETFQTQTCKTKKKFKDILTVIFVLQDYKDSSTVSWKKYIKDPLKSAEKFQYESHWCLAVSKCQMDRKRRAQKYQEHQNRQ